jgi:hypothetical protein
MSLTNFFDDFELGAKLSEVKMSGAFSGLIKGLNINILRLKMWDVNGFHQIFLKDLFIYK